MCPWPITSLVRWWPSFLWIPNSASFPQTTLMTFSASLRIAAKMGGNAVGGAVQWLVQALYKSLHFQQAFTMLVLPMSNVVQNETDFCGYSLSFIQKFCSKYHISVVYYNISTHILKMTWWSDTITRVVPIVRNRSKSSSSVISSFRSISVETPSGCLLLFTFGLIENTNEYLPELSNFKDIFFSYFVRR